MQDIRRTSPDGGVPPFRDPVSDSDRQKTASVSRSRFFSGYTRLRTLESFQHRDFGVLWAVMFCMSISGWIINIATGWLTYELTSSPLLTGLAIGMGAIPPVIIAPIAGVLIDSLDRKKVMIAAMGSFALFIGLFGVIVILGILQPWHIFAVSFLMGVSGSFLLPAEQAILANVVPKKRLVNAFALVAFAGSVTRLIAPAVTGVLIALIGPGACIMLACAFVLAGIKLTLHVRVAERERQPIRPKTVVTDLREAGRYVKGSQVVLAMMVLTTAMLTFVSTINMGLMPVFASDVFEAGPQVLGLLVAALGAGMTIGTIAIATVGDSRRRGRIVLITGTINGTGSDGLFPQWHAIARLPDHHAVRGDDGHDVDGGKRAHPVRRAGRAAGQDCGAIGYDTCLLPSGHLICGRTGAAFRRSHGHTDFRDVHPRRGTCDSGGVSQRLELPGRRQPGRGRRGYGR